MSEKRTEILGHFGVDSGQCIIADPSYLEYFKSDGFYPDPDGVVNDEAGAFSSPKRWNDPVA